MGDKEQEAEPPEPEAESERMTQQDKLKMMNKQFNRVPPSRPPADPSRRQMYSGSRHPRA